MRAIIIGAGRGIRLMPTTADHPKCFAQIKGTRILDWILHALKSNGIEDICFVGGYRIEKVQKDYPQFTYRHNKDWENNNILESLMHAKDLMNEPFICCYSDILISPGLVENLCAASGEITLAVDTAWLERYQFRTEHPPDDAEKITAKNGIVARIHRGIDPKITHGEYTGVAKFSSVGGENLKESYQRCKQLYSGKPFRESPVFEKAYAIQLFQEMIEMGTIMHHSDTQQEYMEIDTQQDFELAQTQWKLEL